MPEDEDAAATVDGDGRTGFEVAFVAGRERALRFEAGAVLAAARVGEARRLRLQPDDMDSTVRPNGKLRAVDRPHPGYRERPAVDPLRLGPGRGARSERDAEQVATVGPVGDVDEVHRAPGIDDGAGRPAALGDPKRRDAPRRAATASALHA